MHRNRSDFCDLRLRCPSRTPQIASDFRDKTKQCCIAIEACDGKSLAICDFKLRTLSPKPLLSAGFLAISLTLQSLLFWISLLFFLFRLSLFCCAFFLSFPRILGVPQREKPLLFGGFPLLFPNKQGSEGQDWWLSPPRNRKRLRLCDVGALRLRFLDALR